MEQKIKSMYESGLNGPQVAKELKIGLNAVYKSLHRQKIFPSQLIANRERNRIGLFTPKQDKEIANLYRDKKSLSKLAKIYCCCTGAIKNALRREKVKMNPKGNRYREFNKDETKDIINRWNAGDSQRRIGLQYNAHQCIIGRILRENGIVNQARKCVRKKHGSWKGGRVNIHGYIYILMEPTDKYLAMAQRGGYVAEHRLVMAKKLDRILESYETVHHLNGSRDNNKIENLELRTSKHGKGICYQCADCGSQNIIVIKLRKGKK